MVHCIQSPQFGLRMNHLPFDRRSAKANEDIIDELRALIIQEKTIYTCRDYLGRRTSRRLKENDSMSLSYERDTTVNCICRETMCEWSYTICDDYNINREIVAISMSLLDRFVDKCSCDRTAFKLAAMTTLYLATKTTDSKQILMSSLTNLSQGEFSVGQMVEMERIILKTLGWRVNPPTVQAFIRCFSHLMPDNKQSQIICTRATFFAELCLYDYVFVPHDRSMIAVASILNAMESIHNVSQRQKLQFLHALHEAIGLNIQTDVIEALCNQLWYVYNLSSQCRDENYLPMLEVSERSLISEKGVDKLSYSPVSVGTPAMHWNESHNGFAG